MVRFNSIDPGMIMGVVVSMVILSVGIFAFFVTLNSIQDIDDEKLEETIDNIDENANSVFNIIGIVLIIGAMMAVVGLVYSYVGPSGYSSSSSKSSHRSNYSSSSDSLTYSNIQKKKPRTSIIGKPPFEIGDYTLHNMFNVDDALEKAKELRTNGHWVKIKNFSKDKKVKTIDERVCGLYVSKWTKDDEDISNKPKFR